MPPKKPRMLLVGWDAADWKVARPLMAAGDMPNLARIVARGASGNLATLQPPLSPMLWTSIATGKRPHKHGIHGFSEPTPDGTSVRPITTLGRTTKAIWNILHQSNLRPSVVGWWPSFPVEPINGVMVSNMFHHAGDGPEARPLPKNAVHPPEWADRLAELRMTPMELPGEAIAMFAPEYKRIDQAKDKRLLSLGRIIAETMSVHAAATEVLEFAEWDFAGIYYDSIDHFSHAFMGYHPPKQNRISDEDFAILGPVIANAYRYHDAMLGRLLELAGPDTTVMVLSDHGFHPDSLRPAHIPAEAAGPAIEHRDFGMFALAGPGIKAGETVYGASLLDIAPTLLHIFGLPIGADMDGKVLVTAFESPRPVARIPSWDDVPGDAGTHAAEAQLDPVASAEAMRQLIDLGYVAAPGPNAQETVTETIAELKYNLARSFDDAGQADRAIPLYEFLHAHDPADQRYAERLIASRLQTHDIAGARATLDEFDARCAVVAPEAAAELAKLREEKPDDQIEMRQTRELQHRRRLSERSSGFPAIRALLRLQINLAEDRTDEARACLAQLESIVQSVPRVPALRLAEAYARLDDTAKALEWTDRALAIDPEDWQALALSARLHLKSRRPAQALDAATASLSLVFHQPVLHYIVGRVLMSRGQYKPSENSLRLALNQMPGLVPAHDALVRLYDKLDRATDATIHRNLAKELRARGKTLAAEKRASRNKGPAPIPTSEPFTPQPGQPAAPATDVVVVAGLPRSGTSMLMQLLAAADIPILTDNLRAPDDDNPRGYLEFEPATHLATDASWIPQSRGKAVKLALQLVQHLPPGQSYRVILIDRDIREVLASQTKMLTRLGRQGANLTNDALAMQYHRQKEDLRRWLGKHPEVALLPLTYDAVLSSPEQVAREIAAFLARDFNPATAAAAVQPSLRRQFAKGDEVATLPRTGAE